MLKCLLTVFNSLLEPGGGGGGGDFCGVYRGQC